MRENQLLNLFLFFLLSAITLRSGITARRESLENLLFPCPEDKKKTLCNALTCFGTTCQQFNSILNSPRPLAVNKQEIT